MAEPHTYKIVELVGSSPDGVDAAIESALARASKTLRNLDWFEVRQIRGAIGDGGSLSTQVTLGVGFRILDPEDLHRERGAQPIRIRGFLTEFRVQSSERGGSGVPSNVMYVHRGPGPSTIP